MKNDLSDIIAQLCDALGAESETPLLDWITKLKTPGGWLQVGYMLAPIKELRGESPELGIAVRALEDAEGYAKAWRHHRKGKRRALPWNQSVEVRGGWAFHLQRLVERLRGVADAEQSQVGGRTQEQWRWMAVGCLCDCLGQGLPIPSNARIAGLVRVDKSQFTPKRWPEWAGLRRRFEDALVTEKPRLTKDQALAMELGTVKRPH